MSAPVEHVWNPFHGEDRLYDPPKFRVFKGWGKNEEIGTDGEFFFVLRPERDKAGWDALWAYADAVEHRSPNLAAQIRDKLGEIRIKQGV